MNWGSVSEFFAMGGHGLFVWGSYGAVLAALLAEPWLARRQHRRALAGAAQWCEETAEEAEEAEESAERALPPEAALKAAPTASMAAARESTS